MQCATSHPRSCSPGRHAALARPPTIGGRRSAATGRQPPSIGTAVSPRARVEHVSSVSGVGARRPRASRPRSRTSTATRPRADRLMSRALRDAYRPRQRDLRAETAVETFIPGADALRSPRSSSRSSGRARSAAREARDLRGARPLDGVLRNEPGARNAPSRNGRSGPARARPRRIPCVRPSSRPSCRATRPSSGGARHAPALAVLAVLLVFSRTTGRRDLRRAAGGSRPCAPRCGRGSPGPAARETLDRRRPRRGHNEPILRHRPVLVGEPALGRGEASE